MHCEFATKYRPSISGCRVTPNIVGYWTLLDFCREAKASGYKLDPFNLLPEGLTGFIAQKSSFQGSRRSGPKSVEAYYLCYPVFGTPLKCDSRSVDSSEWQDTLEEHSDHGDDMYLYKAAESLESVFVCYCKASEGISIMRRTSQKELAQMKSRAEEVVEALMTENEEEHSLF